MGKLVSAMAVDGPLIGGTLYIPEDGRWTHTHPTTEGVIASFEVWSYIPRKVTEWLWVAVATKRDCYEMHYLEPVLIRTDVLNKTSQAALHGGAPKPE